MVATVGVSIFGRLYCFILHLVSRVLHTVSLR